MVPVSSGFTHASPRGRLRRFARLGFASLLVSGLCAFGVTSFTVPSAFAASTSVSGVVNSYQKVTAVSGTTVSVTGAVTGLGQAFAVGDRVMLIQMTGLPPVVTGSSMGNYDIAIVTAVSGSDITLSSVTRTYAPATEAVQLVKTHVDTGTTTVTGPVTAAAWDGSTGGVVSMTGSVLQLDSNIDATGTGFTNDNPPTTAVLDATTTGVDGGSGVGDTAGRGKPGLNGSGAEVTLPGGGLGGGGGTNTYSSGGTGGGTGGGIGGGAMSARDRSFDLNTGQYTPPAPAAPVFGLDGGASIGAWGDGGLEFSGHPLFSFAGSGGGGGITGGGGGGGGGAGLYADQNGNMPSAGGAGGGIAGGGSGGVTANNGEPVTGAGGGGVGGVGNGGDGAPGGPYDGLFGSEEGSPGGGGGSYGGGGGGSTTGAGGDDSTGGGGGGSWTGGGLGGGAPSIVGTFPGQPSATIAGGGDGNDAMTIPIPDSAHYLNTTNPRLMMGGAGGRGSQDSGYSLGGSGGGIVFVDYATIAGLGNIISDGGQGLSPAGGGAHSGSGGGGGGQMRIRVSDTVTAPALVLQAKGGVGGTATSISVAETGGEESAHAGVAGAGGGGGGVWFEYPTAVKSCPSDDLNVPSVSMVTDGGETGPSIINPKNGSNANVSAAGGNGLGCVSPLASLGESLVSVGDYVWNDDNENGVQDSNEVPIAGVVVNLLDDNGNVIKSTVTDENGFYSFTDLKPNWDYTVEFVKPSGSTFTQPSLGGDAARDSNANVSTGRAPVHTPLSGNNSATTPDDPTIDAGIIPGRMVSVGNYVWVDANRNGVQDAGEVPVVDMIVNLLDDAGNVLKTTTTDENGFYSFTDLEPSTPYKIQFVKPAGSTFTTAVQGGDSKKDSNPDVSTGIAPFTSPARGHNTATAPDDPTIDAGIVSLVSVGDYVWNDTNKNGVQDAGEAPVAGVVVNLFDNNGNLVKTTTTDENGFYSFTDLNPSTPYVIEFVKPSGSKFTQPSQGGDTALDSNPDVSTGRVSFTSPASGVNSASTPDDPTIDAGIVPAVSVGDYVWTDVNGNGVQDAGDAPIAGVVVNLYDNNGNLIKTTTTDENGFYSFTDLTPGDEYTVEFVKPDGSAFTSPLQGGDTGLDSNADVSTGRYTFRAPLTGINSATSPDDPTIDAGIVLTESGLADTGVDVVPVAVGALLFIVLGGVGFLAAARRRRESEAK